MLENPILKESYWTELSSTMIDKVIGGYQILESLGHGAYGALFLGQALKSNDYVAIKILSKSTEPQQLEIDLQSSLNHPNLLRLFNVIQDDQFIYMIMELCDGGDLFDFVLSDNDRPEDLIKSFFLQILDGVEAMHQTGIYHRDLKLENILLLQSADALVCKVADFGLATRDRYSIEFGCGSTSYLAPEHFLESDVPYDAAASDTWSLAILLLALMFGRNPWSEASSNDPAFLEFKRNPLMLKHQLFPEISMATFRLLKDAMTIHGTDRISVSDFKVRFMAIDHLFDDDDEDAQVIHIPNVKPVKNSLQSFDSAFFSGGMSWSDMIEEDEAKLDLPRHPSPLSQSSMDDEEDDMFVHQGEKESWWL